MHRVLPRSIDIASRTGAPLIAAMLSSPPGPRQSCDDDDTTIVAISAESIRIDGPSGPTTITVSEAVSLAKKLVNAVNEARRRR